MFDLEVVLGRLTGAFLIWKCDVFFARLLCHTVGVSHVPVTTQWCLGVVETISSGVFKLSLVSTQQFGSGPELLNRMTMNITEDHPQEVWLVCCIKYISDIISYIFNQSVCLSDPPINSCGTGDVDVCFLILFSSLDTLETPWCHPRFCHGSQGLSRHSDGAFGSRGPVMWMASLRSGKQHFTVRELQKKHHVWQVNQLLNGPLSSIFYDYVEFSEGKCNEILRKPWSVAYSSYVRQLGCKWKFHLVIWCGFWGILWR